MTISTLFWILFALMCVSSITMTVLYYQHDAELDRLNVKVEELLGLHNLLPQAEVKRELAND